MSVMDTATVSIRPASTSCFRVSISSASLRAIVSPSVLALVSAFHCLRSDGATLPDGAAGGTGFLNIPVHRSPPPSTRLGSVIMTSMLSDLPPEDAARLMSLPCTAESIGIDQLEGGITNRNYRLRRSSGDLVVRLSDPGSSDLAIDRENEYLNTLAAAQAGAGPEVVDYRRGEGILVVRWIEGRTFTTDDVGTPENLPRIASACLALHGGPAFASRFDMFDLQARYLTLVRERGYRLPPRYDEFSPVVERIRLAMRESPEALVPCNNDLLAANFIDDGARVWLIDYEYSGSNEASFELGNIWSESTLSDDLLELLTMSYWGEYSAEKIARARLWALMSKYGWTLWASIQQAVSPIDFDYWSWGMEKYERAVSEFDSSLLDSWLDEVARP
ncbi:MAG: phosphotransferase [Actinobacteria bacterium]|nr:phosphotransferase [Actinomycetota bacterium]